LKKKNGINPKVCDSNQTGRARELACKRKMKRNFGKKSEVQSACREKTDVGRDGQESNTNEHHLQHEEVKYREGEVGKKS